MARKEKKYHYIYKITCLKNNRYYIGMHSTDNLDDGYFGGGKRIKNSVKKHGKDAHRKDILEFFGSRDLLRQREVELVNEELLNDPMCMNLQIGGGGGLPISWDYNKIKEFHSDGGKKSSKIMKEKFNLDKEYREWIGNIRSKTVSQAWRDGKLNATWGGKNHTEETKKIIGEKNKISQKGDKNSQFGTLWITNRKENKKIKNTELIPEGWERGRC